MIGTRTGACCLALAWVLLCWRAHAQPPGRCRPLGWLMVCCRALAEARIPPGPRLLILHHLDMYRNPSAMLKPALPMPMPPPPQPQPLQQQAGRK